MIVSYYGSRLCRETGPLSVSYTSYLMKENIIGRETQIADKQEFCDNFRRNSWNFVIFMPKTFGILWFICIFAIRISVSTAISIPSHISSPSWLSAGLERRFNNGNINVIWIAYNIVECIGSVNVISQGYWIFKLRVFGLYSALRNVRSPLRNVRSPLRYVRSALRNVTRLPYAYTFI